jgi:hypothetical protein
MPTVQQSEEVGLIVAAGGNQFTVDDAGFCWEPQKRRRLPQGSGA